MDLNIKQGDIEMDSRQPNYPSSKNKLDLY